MTYENLLQRAVLKATPKFGRSNGNDRILEETIQNNDNLIVQESEIRSSTRSSEIVSNVIGFLKKHY